MDPVSRLTKALAGLRRAGVAGGNRKSNDVKVAAPAAGTTSTKARKTDAELRTEIARRIVQIDTSQPDQRSAAVRVFIEQVLGREFGHSAVASAAFQRRIADVEAAMSRDPDTRREVEGLIEDLREQAKRC
jgi:hypothetical protein